MRQLVAWFSVSWLHLEACENHLKIVCVEAGVGGGGIGAEEDAQVERGRVPWYLALSWRL